MEIKLISNENRRQINQFIISHWFSTDMVIRGKVFDMTILDGYAAYENEKIIGLITYRIEDNECEIMSLDSLIEKQGIGSTLLSKAVKRAKENKCKKIKLITTNDNINAIRFYQKRGFDMAKLYHNAVDISRKLKPSIPLIGDFNIPLKHEIEFQMYLS
ncbi:N-acetyltransferase [Clostridium sp. 2-1]|uniref:Protease synthase and sporulation negative regulatory protein PAI 1 n=1 Tax=Clostridium beijerinckii TaxID=1520 RepID=A0A1S8S290_CLOBE|nr:MULTISPECIES: GNAT family N-acetyltransferase [Clostridium]MBN7577010.1 GNAT family N-acetyltransferase [Clostridium beijerinckii]MBN7580163.1 GNAT family N-acetyltransferase [Clostridium beijerinckii]MBN7586791.1 GNAT family N-acetyltransferase [Clostridium beijerinckii]MBO0522994.1 GNAT family N-acetyltransferase [Clostridium beijerinckii]NRY58919.1 ribosomal protein S18 acetylase RimI-like enzyme [Clostridium beijerinckii]